MLVTLYHADDLLPQKLRDALPTFAVSTRERPTWGKAQNPFSAGIAPMSRKRPEITSASWAKEHHQ